MPRHPLPIAEVLKVATHCHGLLEQIPHVVIGGLAVHLHGCNDETRDVDLLVSRNDFEAIRQALIPEGYVWNDFRRAYSKNKVRVDFRFSGDDAGNHNLHFPDPLDSTTGEFISGFTVLGLPWLVATKLSGAGTGKTQSKREQSLHKHHTDVIRIIHRHCLDESFQERLDPSVRNTFLQLVRNESQ